jgi:hypothetical protein
MSSEDLVRQFTESRSRRRGAAHPRPAQHRAPDFGPPPESFSGSPAFPGTLTPDAQFPSPFADFSAPSQFTSSPQYPIPEYSPQPFLPVFAPAQTEDIPSMADDNDTQTRIAKMTEENELLKDELALHKKKIQILEQQIFIFFTKLSKLEQEIEAIPK